MAEPDERGAEEGGGGLGFWNYVNCRRNQTVAVIPISDNPQFRAASQSNPARGRYNHDTYRGVFADSGGSEAAPRLAVFPLLTNILSIDGITLAGYVRSEKPRNIEMARIWRTVGFIGTFFVGSPALAYCQNPGFLFADEPCVQSYFQPEVPGQTVYTEPMAINSSNIGYHPFSMYNGGTAISTLFKSPQVEAFSSGGGAGIQFKYLIDTPGYINAPLIFTGAFRHYGEVGSMNTLIRIAPMNTINNGLLVSFGSNYVSDESGGMSSSFIQVYNHHSFDKFAQLAVVDINTNQFSFDYDVIDKDDYSSKRYNNGFLTEVIGNDGGLSKTESYVLGGSSSLSTFSGDFKIRLEGIGAYQIFLSAATGGRGYAYIDPVITIDPDFLALHPDAYVRVSGGLPNEATSPVPEPSTWRTFIIGFALIGGIARRGDAKTHLLGMRAAT